MDHLFIRFLFLLSTKVHRLKEEDCISASIDDDEDRIEGVVQEDLKNTTNNGIERVEYGN
ncbi:hypothetical protein BLOT_006839 [Blomia tropicalis]|nr:hypothetical protein BLOT_006839 [Blomia tropicalis]